MQKFSQESTVVKANLWRMVARLTTQESQIYQAFTSGIEGLGNDEINEILLKVELNLEFSEWLLTQMNTSIDLIWKLLEQSLSLVASIKEEHLVAETNGPPDSKISNSPASQKPMATYSGHESLRKLDAQLKILTMMTRLRKQASCEGEFEELAPWKEFLDQAYEVVMKIWKQMFDLEPFALAMWSKCKQANSETTKKSVLDKKGSVSKQGGRGTSRRESKLAQLTQKRKSCNDELEEGAHRTPESWATFELPEDMKSLMQFLQDQLDEKPDSFPIQLDSSQQNDQLLKLAIYLFNRSNIADPVSSLFLMGKYLEELYLHDKMLPLLCLESILVGHAPNKVPLSCMDPNVMLKKAQHQALFPTIACPARANLVQLRKLEVSSILGLRAPVSHLMTSLKELSVSNLQVTNVGLKGENKNYDEFISSMANMETPVALDLIETWIETSIKLSRLGECHLASHFHESAHSCLVRLTPILEKKDTQVLMRLRTLANLGMSFVSLSAGHFSDGIKFAQEVMKAGPAASLQTWFTGLRVFIDCIVLDHSKVVKPLEGDQLLKHTGVEVALRAISETLHFLSSNASFWPQRQKLFQLFEAILSETKANIQLWLYSMNSDPLQVTLLVNLCNLLI
ncbi:hypothetical protein Ciccas_010451 [Cichlidogyrus casuarinus]|uniref:Uncharacterized protein n=1 Tax=Cichlidogyrus casuarinus TaxID=1844966 RepID=A0ABD2PUM7_9PLAT